MIDLRLGDYRDVLADVAECDVLLTDTPYSERTASGYKTNPDWKKHVGSQPGIEYGFITEEWVAEFVSSWWPRTRHWFIAFGDHISQAWWATELERAGAYVFAPVPWLKTDAPPRFVGDGPASAVEWITVGRHGYTVAKGSPRRGSRPPFYKASVRHGLVTGGKDPAGIRAIVRDYTLPGDLIVDPCAGGATTLLAAAMEGRRAVGAEIDPVTYDKAMARLSRGYQTPLFSEAAGKVGQGILL